MAHPPRRPFKDVLRELRHGANLTQEELAERAGLSARTISDLERGEKQFPRKDSAQMLADGFGFAGAARDEFLAAARKPVGPGLTTPGERRRVELPAPATPLIGRAETVAAASAAIEPGGARLLTLTGPGGVGKTRLAIAAAAALAGAFDIVLFVPLAAVGDPELVLPAIARALGGPRADAEPALEHARAALGDARALLVLDNVEQVAGAAPRLAALLEACPRLALLATSRATLRVRAEREFPVAPLAVPEPGGVDPADDPERYPAAALFLDRARAIDPEFAVSPEQSWTLAEICRRLDGLPLAIELAAARVRVLSLPAILARLERRLDVLIGGPSDLPGRQQTMRAAIAWSHDLLTPPEQTLFRRLAVLADGFTLDAAEAVDAAGGSPGIDLLTGLEALVEHSLVRRLEAEGDARFGMLQTIREFGLEQLTLSGETAAVVQAHTDHYVALVETAQAEWTAARQAEMLGRLEWAHDNLRAALSRTLTERQGDSALRLTGSLARFWYLHGHWTEGRGWLDQALAAARDEPSLGYARSRFGAGLLAEAQGEPELAHQHYEAALALFTTLGYAAGRCYVLNNLGNVLDHLGQSPDALARYEQARDVCREAGEKQGIALALQNLGILAALEGQADVAEPLLSESLALLREVGDRRGLGSALATLGSLAFREGEVERASALCAESLAITRELGNREGEAVAMIYVGEIALHQREFGRAEACFDAALEIFETLGDPWGEASALAGLGGVALRRDGDRIEARQALGAALALFEQTGDREQVAWCVDELGHVRAAGAQWELAARLLGFADALREANCLSLAPVFRPAREAMAAAAESALGADRFQAAREAGAVIPLAHIVANAVRDEPLPR